MCSYAGAVTRQCLGNHAPATTNTHVTIEALLETVFSAPFLQGGHKDSWSKNISSRVEAGSYTSTVALRVVGGDEIGSLESETVKYGCEPHGTRTREWQRWRAPAAIVNGRPVFSSGRKRLISTNPQLSHSNRNMGVSPKCLIPRQTGRLTVGCNVRLRLGPRLRFKGSLVGRKPVQREFAHGNRGIALVRSRYQETVKTLDG
jgi:hypothetical protein